MLTTEIGLQAEEAVVEYLQSNGYDIIAKNWKTKTCEVDIIAYKNQMIYFVEVKYRSTQHQGRGFDYINKRKIRRMNYAAQLWVYKNNWYGGYALSAASVSGGDYTVEFTEQI